MRDDETDESSWGRVGGDAGDGDVDDAERIAEAIEVSTEQPARRSLGEEATVVELLSQLPEGGRVQLWRKKPTWCAGFLTSIDLEAGDDIDLGQLKRDWGGGTISLRPQARTPKGYRFTGGGISLHFTGPPLEHGQPIYPDGRMPAPTELVRQSLAPLGSPILPGGRTGNQALDVLAALVERLDSRLASMEARLATPPTPPDPLADVQRTLAMAKAFGQLRDTFASGRDDRDDDDDDDDDDEEPEAPGLEGVAMRFVESKLREMEKETGAADVAPANPRPHVQPSSPAPSARPRAPAPMPPRAQPTPAAATAAARAVVVDVDPYATPAVEQGWGTVVEIGREQERPAEREPAGDVDADAIIRTIERLPSDEALDLIAEAVSRLPRDKLLDFVQRMQAKEE